MVRSFGRLSRWSGATLVLLVAGCQTYTARPLDPAEILKTVDTARRVEVPLARVDLVQAVQLAELHSPTLRVALAQDESARSVAAIPVPLANPSLSAGPTYLADADIIGGKQWGFEAASGWLLDLAGLRSATNDLRQVEALATHVNAVATQRETYLALRRAFTRLSTARHLSAAAAGAETAAHASLATAVRLVDAAQATALDTYQHELEAQRASAGALEALESEDDARAELAALVGVEAAAFQDVEAPIFPDEVPDRAALLGLISGSHPALDRLRAEFDVAESRLEREILAQYPGLDLGPGFEREDDVDKYSLSFGVELPLFDRNQIGIAEAEGVRELVRLRYETEVARRITEVEAALTRLGHRRARLALLVERAIPAAERALAMAEGGWRSGVIDTLHYLGIARMERAVQLELIDAEQSVIDAWCDLEAATGAPLLRFPSMTVESAAGAKDGVR